jgi:hypothetical protein
MKPPSPPTLPAEIRAIIDRLRRRVRQYVWLEGLAIAVVCLGLAFWIGLALDYLPVLAGSSEMPRAVRAVLLSFVAAVLMGVLYRWVFRRALVPLRGRSLALLIERQVPEFHESLVTTVEAADAASFDESVNRGLLEQSARTAVDRLNSVDLSRVFDYRPLRRALTGAVLAMASVLAFVAFSNGAFDIWVRRFFLLSDDPWPRKAFIEVVGFTNRKLLVAEGSDVTIRVKADANRVLPDRCMIVYRTAGGERNRVAMSKEGEPRNGQQYYVFSSAPFQGMLESVDFDVIGYDHRVRDYHVAVVPSPVIVDVRVKYEPPPYTGLLPREEKWSVGMRCPMGSHVQVIATANKPLRSIEMNDSSGGKARLISPETDASRFRIDVGDLRDEFATHLTLVDIHEIRSQQPFRLTIGATQDQIPQLRINLEGIGDAVTPDVRLPAVGTVQDDYGIEKCWFEIHMGDESQRQFPIEPFPSDRLETALDMREQRMSEQEPFVLQPGQQMTLVVKARDRFNVAGQPNVGQSDSFSLRVVDGNELLALLGARELGLRRRFEQIIAEMTETRDSLIRIRPAGSEGENAGGADSNGESDIAAGDTAEDADETLSPDREQSLRVLRVQRARQQGAKSTQEVQGVIAAFQNIRAELINNRVDSAERRERIEFQIVEPLQGIAGQMFPDWFATIDSLEEQLQKNQSYETTTVEAIRKTDDILLAMERILRKMEELESYNELVDLVRTILEQQQELLEKTQEERKAQAKSLIE